MSFWPRLQRWAFWAASALLFAFLLLFWVTTPAGTPSDPERPRLQTDDQPTP